MRAPSSGQRRDYSSQQPVPAARPAGPLGAVVRPLGGAPGPRPRGDLPSFLPSDRCPQIPPGRHQLLHPGARHPPALELLHHRHPGEPRRPPRVGLRGLQLRTEPGVLGPWSRVGVSPCASKPDWQRCPLARGTIGKATPPYTACVLRAQLGAQLEFFLTGTLPRTCPWATWGSCHWDPAARPFLPLKGFCAHSKGKRGFGALRLAAVLKGPMQLVLEPSFSAWPPAKPGTPVILEGKERGPENHWQ